MRVYAINIFGTVSLALILNGISSVWTWVVAAGYLMFWLHDRVVSDVPLYRNYPVLGRLQSTIKPILSGSSDNLLPYARGTFDTVRSYARGVTPYSSFGKQTLSNNKYAIRHVMFPKDNVASDFRITIGGTQCRQRYACSILNISALSFGSITPNAIKTLSCAADKGRFFYNTGEAGIHQNAFDGNGDLVWQIGTGYFGCRTIDGTFDERLFEQKANLANVKMIEIKISQGSKPALGGFLPGSKVSQEVATLCGIPVHKDSILPTAHSAFSSVEALPDFIAKIRQLSNGKPIGLKLCVGNQQELGQLFHEMKKSSCYPDFIAIDGNNGGTGSAPVEYQDSVGMPLLPALTIVDNLLVEYGLREEIRILASGQISVARDMFIALAHGADICVAARPFLIAMGCVQALACGSSLCPAGITSSHPWLDKAVKPEKRSRYLVNYQQQMRANLGNLVASAGLSTPSEITRSHLFTSEIVKPL